MNRYAKRAALLAILVASLSFASAGARSQAMRLIPAGQLTEDTVAPRPDVPANAPDRPGAEPAPPAPRVVSIAAFLLDERTVSAADFARFVREHAEWRRSQVGGLRAESDYLKDWRSDIDPGAHPERPAVYVSWFAATAYCEARGARLPTTDEWEYTAQRGDPDFAKKALEWFARPTPAVLPPAGSTPRNALGVRDLASLVWEWTSDFNAQIPPEGTSCGAGSQGATDATDYAGFMRRAFRGSLRGDFTLRNLGFRCAMDLQGTRGGLKTEKEVVR